MQEEFLSTKDVATRWKVSTQSLNRWRLLLCGPPYVQLGKAVRYKLSDILEFERNGLHKPIPRAVAEVPAPQKNEPQLTVRDVVVSLNLGDCDGDPAMGGARTAK